MVIQNVDYCADDARNAKSVKAIAEKSLVVNVSDPPGTSYRRTALNASIRNRKKLVN